MRVRLLVLLALCLTFGVVGTALAQDNPTEDAYGGVLGEEVASQDDSSGQPSQADDDDSVAPAAATQQTGDTLPFTGLEIGLIVLAGLGLVVLGVTLRRGTRHAPE